MKTSIKILIITGLSFCLLLITGLVVVKSSLENLPGRTKVARTYNKVETGNFEKLELPEHTEVTITHGDTYALEIFPADVNTMVMNKNNTLHLIRKTKGELRKDTIFVKITAPSIKSIKAEEGTKLLLQNFTGDSITIHLQNRSVLTEMNNSYKYKSIITEGRYR